MNSDTEEEKSRFRYRTRVQAVAVIDILVGTIPFIKLAFAFNDKHLADLYQDREYLVFVWSVLLCVYVLQLIMGIWLLAATREVYSEYTVGNCQVWFYVAIFTFVFYTGEMAVAIQTIINTPSSSRKSKEVFITMSYHGAKIIYRAATLMIVNNFLYDICRPVYRYLSQGSYQYKHYYHTRLGIPLPSRRTSIAASAGFPIQPHPNYRYYSSYPQPQNKLPQQGQVTTAPLPLRRPNLSNSINPYANSNNVCSSNNNFVRRTEINLARRAENNLKLRNQYNFIRRTDNNFDRRTQNSLVRRTDNNFDRRTQNNLVRRTDNNLARRTNPAIDSVWKPDAVLIPAK